MEEGPVDGGGQEARVGVSVHQRVDLQLSVLEGQRCWVLHLPVDHFSHPGIQTDLGTEGSDKQEVRRRGTPRTH